MKKSSLAVLSAVNIGIIAAICILNYVYQRNDFIFTLKCICSGGFALLGVIDLCYALATKQRNLPFFISMTLGLLLAMLGDVLIGYTFVIGAAVFALGHICFIVAYRFLQKITVLDLIISGVVFLGALLFLLFCPLLSFEVPLFKAVCILYALIISVMLGKALGNVIHDNCAVTRILAVAGALFFFSDLMLVFDWFIGLWDWTSEACMGTYYPALCLLAFSMYWKIIQKHATVL